LYRDHHEFSAGALRKIFGHERRDLRLLSHRRAGHEAQQSQRNESGHHSPPLSFLPRDLPVQRSARAFRDTAPIASAPAPFGRDSLGPSPMQDQAFARERRSHSSRPMRPRRASPNGTSERSSTRPPQYRAPGSHTTSRGSPTAFR